MLCVCTDGLVGCGVRVVIVVCQRQRQIIRLVGWWRVCLVMRVLCWCGHMPLCGWQWSA